LASGEELTMKDCGFILEKATHAELARYNITEKLPGSMTEAIQACKDDGMFREKVWRCIHGQIDQPENLGREFAAQGE